MKKAKKVFMCIVFLLALLFFNMKVQAVTIVLDPGHGGNNTGAVSAGRGS
ncbi:MAG: hypothetical protein IKN65_09165 [Clostridia bacterium]|nr:hypothetical protein [Clostridia bacterium]